MDPKTTNKMKKIMRKEIKKRVIQQARGEAGDYINEQKKIISGLRGKLYLWRIFFLISTVCYITTLYMLLKEKGVI